jgi:NitT/TauT family transport system substrate-binding protein
LSERILKPTNLGRSPRKALAASAAVLSLLSAAALAAGCARGHRSSPTEVRLGYFPNLTHAQALLGVARGDFAKAAAPLKLTPRLFNAGPQAMEALFAGELDLVYVGPGPAINAYVRSSGRALRVVAGAASGGAALVVRAESGIARASDLDRRILASPQLGNTQDIALRTYLRENGLAPLEQGGSVRITAIANPDILSLMKRGEIDGAWVPEPWVTRLLREADARMHVDERTLWPDGRFTTAVVVTSQAFLGEHPELVRRILQAHVELTEWIRANPAEAREQLNAELGRLLGKPLPIHILTDAFSRMEVTYDPVETSLMRTAERAFDLGFLGRERPDTEGLVDICLLDDVLAEKGLARLGAGAGGDHHHGPAR